MSKWSEISNPLQQSVGRETAAIKDDIANYSGLVPITIVTADNRTIEAVVHQGTRSVYPKTK